MSNTASTSTTTTTLPPAFLLLCEAALSAHCYSDESAVEPLQRLAPEVAQVLSLENLLAREHDLTGLAWRLFERERDEADDQEEREIAAVRMGVDVGIVAGFLLARMMQEAR